MLCSEMIPVKRTLDGLGRIALFTQDVVSSVFSGRWSWREVVRQFYFIGNKSLAVVLVTGGFTGMVLCAQTFFQFHKVKMDTATLAVVSISLCSELGPVLAGLMVTGRVGASMTAELGTMRVTEQIDALRTLATHPVDYLVVPRMLATIVALPLLTTGAIAVGILAGYLVGVHLLGIDPTYSYHNMIEYTDASDLMVGVVKATFFGAMIALISCFKGMNCGQGAEGVGRATTEAVVAASMTILVSNFFLTLFLGHLFE